MSSNGEDVASTGPGNNQKRRSDDTGTDPAALTQPPTKRTRLSTADSVNPTLAAATSNKSQIPYKDRFLDCKNCDTVFDAFAPSCHVHEEGPKTVLSKGYSFSGRASRKEISPERDDCECVYHPGEMEVDHAGGFWADHEEEVHGTIDCEASREEYPEGFLWSCCDQPGDVRGCTWGSHQKGTPGEYAMRRGQFETM